MLGRWHVSFPIHNERREHVEVDHIPSKSLSYYPLIGFRLQEWFSCASHGNPWSFKPEKSRCFECTLYPYSHNPPNWKQKQRKSKHTCKGARTHETFASCSTSDLSLDYQSQLMPVHIWSLDQATKDNLKVHLSQLQELNLWDNSISIHLICCHISHLSSTRMILHYTQISRSVFLIQAIRTLEDNNTRCLMAALSKNHSVVSKDLTITLGRSFSVSARTKNGHPVFSFRLVLMDSTDSSDCMLALFQALQLPQCYLWSPLWHSSSMIAMVIWEQGSV